MAESPVFRARVVEGLDGPQCAACRRPFGYDDGSCGFVEVGALPNMKAWLEEIGEDFDDKDLMMTCVQCGEKMQRRV